MKDRIIIYKSRRKAVWTIVAGLILVAVGLLFIFIAGDKVSGWIVIILAVMCLVLGFGQLSDRSPRISITEKGITDLSVVGEEIEWDAILSADNFWYGGQDFVRLLLPRDYKARLIRPSWFWRLDRIYEKEGLKAVYIHMGGLEINSGYLTALIGRMAKANTSQRKSIIFSSHKKI